MVTNLKFYVLTVVSIFLALAIGIYIGFMFDAQDILLSQKEDIVAQLEERFNYLKEENEKIKRDIADISEENKRLYEFNRTVYGEIIKDRLSGVKISIIETNDDYIYTGIKQTLEASGAEVTSITTIKDSLLSDKDAIEAIFKKINKVEDIEGDVVKLTIDQIVQAIILGKNSDIIQSLNDEGIIDASGSYIQPSDYIIIAGGSKNKVEDKINLIDNRIIDISKKANVPIIGIEKQSVKFSYIEKYKDKRISTVDNVDTIIGKVALILAMDGRPGNYGVKPSAESLVPDPSAAIFD